MIHYGEISKEEYLKHYWQKKPLLIKNAIPNFISPLSPNELAGLSCEDEFESRIIKGSVSKNIWTLENGPFNDNSFKNTPNNQWTLLVQGVDKHIQEIYELIDEFNFIPRWRFDDVMISFASLGGSVGPHYDHYDVFLLQGLGKRKWQISSIDCNPNNYVQNSPLRIMENFEIETTWLAEPGDIVYIPPGIAHHGESINDECVTLSVGYRSYSANEILESLDLTTDKYNNSYYLDPIWLDNSAAAEIPNAAIKKLIKLIKNRDLPDTFFGCFVTKLDPLDEEKLNEIVSLEMPLIIKMSATYNLHPLSRIAYQFIDNELVVFINGNTLQITNINDDVIIGFCNTRKIKVDDKNKRLALQFSELSLLEETHPKI
jgi:50S ribosomal protein L16 3-hydroxylase